MAVARHFTAQPWHIAPSRYNAARCRQRRHFLVAGAQQQEGLVAASTSHTAEAAAHLAQPIADIAARAAAAPPPQADTAAAAPLLGPTPLAALLLGGALLAGYGIKKVYDTPSRSYDQNVGQEYDAWTEEGVLEYYWGEHIHLGHYSEEVRSRGWVPGSFCCMAGGWRIPVLMAASRARCRLS